MAAKKAKNGKAQASGEVTVKAKAKARGRPPGKKVDPWRTVLRLPKPLANKLKKAAEANEMSVNTAVQTIVDVWVKTEGL